MLVMTFTAFIVNTSAIRREYVSKVSLSRLQILLGQYSQVISSIESGFDLNSTNGREPPLFLATYSGRSRMVELLLNCGSVATHVDEDVAQAWGARTAEELAERLSYERIASLLAAPNPGDRRRCEQEYHSQAALETISPFLREPALPDDIGKVESDLGVELPSFALDFLSTANGLSWRGVEFFRISDWRWVKHPWVSRLSDPTFEFLKSNKSIELHPAPPEIRVPLLLWGAGKGILVGSTSEGEDSIVLRPPNTGSNQSWDLVHVSLASSGSVARFPDIWSLIDDIVEVEGFGIEREDPDP